MNEDKAERRDLMTGLENAERVEVIAGLAEGEQVIRRGYEGLYAGARVAVVTDAGTRSSVSTGRAASPTTPGSAAPGASGGHSAHATAPALAPQESGGHGGHESSAKVAQAPNPAAPAGKLQINLTSNTVKLSSGKGTLRVELRDARGVAVSGAKVEIGAGMTGMNVAKVPARGTKDAGVYEATLNFGMAGAWTVEVTAAAAQSTSTAAKFNIDAK
jgi:hypothetical protein